MNKAIVVDDSRAMRMLLSSTLTDLGFQVCEAGNGAEAFQMINGEHGDVSLMTVDWNMPVLNGIELVKKVRADSRFKRVPIVMVTSESQMAQVQEALDFGADEYIMKPFTQESLREKFALIGIGE